MNDTNTPATDSPTPWQRWFRPPRAHGDVIDDRVVGFIELFYDLVFVVLIAQIAHTLAAQITWSTVGHFVVIFSMVWIAWLNGSLYHELHGGEDGRSRTYIFAQMNLLVLLSVFAGHAATDVADGRGFAIVYAALLALLIMQWWKVSRQDTPEFRPMVRRALISLAILGGTVLASAFLEDPATRVWVWSIAVVASLPFIFATMLRRGGTVTSALRVTDSLAERFGLFTIIVLGEVVVGVSDGLSEVERSFRAIATGVLALGVGSGLWWSYFDFVRRRIPRGNPESRTAWTFGHLPLALSIAAAGAGMVSLIVAALRPAPWLLALGLFAVLSAVWTESFIRHARVGLTIAEG
jgi:low temperature requirement protein LtrA